MADLFNIPGGKGRATYVAVEGTGVPVVGGISAAVVVTTEILIKYK